MRLLCNILFLAVFLIHAVAVPLSCADERLISENQVKAAFVFNAAHYVSWPQTDRETLLVGILGRGPLSNEWQNISGKSVRGKKIVVFKSNSIGEMLGCHIVLIEESNPKMLSNILQHLNDYPILTISDSPFFIGYGGILNISLVNRRITFSVNLAQARAVGLDISSNLLKLATEVIK